jgi:hypothetical protein
MTNIVTSNVTPCRLVGIYRLFEVTWIIYYIPLKTEVPCFSQRLTISTRPHEVLSLNIVVSFVTSMKTSDLTRYLHKMALIHIYSVLLNTILRRHHGQPRHVREDNIQMSYRRLYIDVIKRFENESAITEFTEYFFPIGCHSAYLAPVPDHTFPCINRNRSPHLFYTLTEVLP